MGVNGKKDIEGMLRELKRIVVQVAVSRLWVKEDPPKENEIKVDELDVVIWLQRLVAPKQRQKTKNRSFGIQECFGRSKCLERARTTECSTRCLLVAHRRLG